MTDSVEEQIIDKQANATVLYAALGVNALLLFIPFICQVPRL